MMILMENIKREMAALPLEQVPNLVAVLGALMATAQLRMITEQAPVTREADGFLTVKEVAQQLKISSYRVYELARQGTLQSVKLGKLVRVKPSAVVEYVGTHGT